MRPEAASYPSYFNAYIKLVQEDDILTALAVQTPMAIGFFDSISEEQSIYKYSEEKWTVKEILQHVIDTERIFCYRSLAIARGEKGVLPGFDEVLYGRNSHANDHSWKELVEEFSSLRKSTNFLVKNLNKNDLSLIGTVNEYQISVLAILYTTAGHVAHHINIIRERYLDIK